MVIPTSQVIKTEIHSDENTCPSHIGQKKSGFELSSPDSRACILPRMSHPSQLDYADVIIIFSLPVHFLSPIKNPKMGICCNTESMVAGVTSLAGGFQLPEVGIGLGRKGIEPKNVQT